MPRSAHPCRYWPAALALALLPALAPAAEPQMPQRLSLPPLPQAPTIDGTLNPAEWAGAARIVGFVETFAPFLEPRQGYTYLGYDAQGLYLAMATELPPSNKLLAEIKQHDENTCHDDSIELWVDPYRANRLAKQGDQRYFQMILNSLGTFLDGSVDPTKGSGPNTAWDMKGHQFKWRIDAEKHMWELELALPWKAFGVESMPADGREIGLLVARNWKNPWVQARAFVTGGFGDWTNYLVITLDPQAPVIQEQGLGPVFEPRVDYQMALRQGAGAGGPYVVETALESSDMPAKRDRQELKPVAGQTAAYHFDSGANYLHKGAQHVFMTRVTSADGQRVYYQRTFAIRDPRAQTWTTPGVAETSTGFWIAYHPTPNRLAVKLDVTQVAGGEKITGATVQVLDSAAKALATEELALREGVAERAFILPPLPNGTYTVRATLKGEGAPAKPFEKTFVRRHFPWERSTLGITSQVYPPFTPVTAKGDEVGVVLRKYRMNGFGLWSSVQAAGKELLAAPMGIEFTTAGGPGKWASAKAPLTVAAGDHVAYSATATAAAVVVTTTSDTEYDGCMKVTMQLQPGARPQEIKELWVSIPLRDEIAPLGHACTSGNIRTNPTGPAPAGQGQVWDSTQTGNGAMLGTMVPYLWLGGPVRGLCWFADNDKGWVTDDEKPAMTLTREKGKLTLRVYLINKPVTLRETRTVVFGLQASPVKPLPTNWRARRNIPMHGGSNGYWGIYSTYAGKYPADNDWRFPDEQLAARICGMSDPTFFRQWVKEKLEEVATDPAWIKDRTAHFGAGMNWAATAKDNPVVPYLEEHYMDQTTPEFVTFQDEWGVKSYTERVWTTKPEESGGAGVNFCESYQNFVMWCMLQWYARGLGMYCDNTFPHNSYNPSFSEAYVREDGQMQCGSCMWALREYHQRLWVLKQQCQALTPYELLISTHMTNGNLLPIIAWGEISLDNEWAWDAGNAPFPPEVLQTEMMGQQAGNWPHALYPVFTNGKNEENLSAEGRERIEWGMRFTHEILRKTDHPLEKLAREFGYGQPECEVVRYWDQEERGTETPGLAVGNPLVKWIMLWKPGEKQALVVLASWSREPQTAEVKWLAPGARRLGAWQDAESGKDVPPGPVRLEGWGVRILQAQVR